MNVLFSAESFSQLPPETLIKSHFGPKHQQKNKNMKFSIATAVIATMMMANESMAQNTMVKMCLHYDNESGHARSDPIINQQCSSGHVRI